MITQTRILVFAATLTAAASIVWHSELRDIDLRLQAAEARAAVPVPAAPAPVLHVAPPSVDAFDLEDVRLAPPTFENADLPVPAAPLPVLDVAPPRVDAVNLEDVRLQRPELARPGADAAEIAAGVEGPRLPALEPLVDLQLRPTGLRPPALAEPPLW